jgi:uncharacterized protein
MAAANAVCTSWKTKTPARCSDYRNRKALVPECVRLTPGKLDDLDWLPETCSYLRIHRGQPLEPWHHLITGDRESIHRAGQSVAGKVISEDHIGDLEDFIIDKPL